MPLEALNLNNPEKKKTSAELAIDHINLESENVERELKKDKRWGRVYETLGSACVGIGVICTALLFESWSGGRGSSQELTNALQNLNFQEFFSSPEAKLLMPAISNFSAGGLLIALGKENIREAVAKAKEKKRHILSQYFGRTETPPQT